MKQLCTLVLFALSCGLSLGTTVDYSNYIRVTPTNAAQLGIKFFYHAPVPALVTIEMAYTKDGREFKDAILEFVSGEQNFKIPLEGKKQEKDMLLLGFWMDRQTLRQSSLQIRFSKKVDIEPTVYVLHLKDFVSEFEKKSDK